MRGNAVISLALATLVLAGISRCAAATATDPVTNAGDLVEFLDGSHLHGGLVRVDPGAGLRWKTPDALQPVDFQPAHVNHIHFSHAGAAPMSARSRLRFANGDDLLGAVTALDNDHLSFNAWFGGALTVSRTAVQSISFLASNYTVLYEGPGDADGWIIGNHNPD